MKRYAIVIEDAGTNLAAYVPDLPGCVATGESEQEVERRIREAIALHLERMAQDGPIPERSARVDYVEVDAWPFTPPAPRALVPSSAGADTGGRLRKSYQPRRTLDERRGLLARALMLSTMGLVTVIYLTPQFHGIALSRM